MECFEKVALNIHNLNLNIALHYLITTLKLRPFVDNICKNPVANLDELKTRPAKFMQMEKLKVFHNATEWKIMPKQPRYSHYTPLTTNKARIWKRP